MKTKFCGKDVLVLAPPWPDFLPGSRNEEVGDHVLEILNWRLCECWELLDMIFSRLLLDFIVLVAGFYLFYFDHRHLWMLKIFGNNKVVIFVYCRDLWVYFGLWM
ncbi:hypothetical protein MRB53_016186 [Persea americana]|uniref:Uncharacterized protein n=1 Tax=Persea americana TaxID=3435 RepID=A0ACC2M167_PERAE|nr:hypothetical protein MRB53_016186 [Persea americana]